MEESLKWSIPTIVEPDRFDLQVKLGELLLIVGPNGSGKSALSYWLANQHLEKPVHRIFAQRQVWMESGAPDITFKQKETIMQVIDRADSKPESRVKDPQGSQRSASILFDLVARVNERNARVAECVDEGFSSEETREKNAPSLLNKINDLMQGAGFHQKFKVGENNSFEAKLGESSYPISDMSDGEKSAFLLAAEVLLAPKSSVIFIDEPERHLHRAISAKFILALAAARRDCAFLLFTHDVNLMTRGLRTILVRSIGWRDNRPSGWDLEEITLLDDHEEQVRLAVYGGRGQILFTEGEMASLDKPLYEIIFPEWTVQPVGNNEQVIRAVAGLKDAKVHHWVNAKGIVDGDCRSPKERYNFRNKGILVLPVNEVENLYYLPFIVEFQANKQANNLGHEQGSLQEKAWTQALDSLVSEDVKENLAAVNAVKILRQKALESLPSKKGVVREKNVNIAIPSPWKEEFDVLCNAVEDDDHEQIVLRFSIRDSAYGLGIAKGLGYQNVSDYQSAVRVSLKENSELLQKLRETIGALPD